MPARFAIDFGTTNTVIATDREGAVTLVALPEIAAERIETPVVPTAVLFREGGPPLIGQGAVSHNLLGRQPGFVQTFKRRLGRESRRPLSQTGGSEVTARRAGEAFFDGLRVALRAQYRPRRRGLMGLWDDFQEHRQPLVADLTLTAPVDADELYRGELTTLGKRLGSRVPRLLDEPVAAALGYGVNVGRELTVLVLDWGGGTLNVSVVRTGPATLAEGRAEVLAKSEAPLGGSDVDRWVVEALLGDIASRIAEWEVDALWEAARVKEAASTYGEAAFRFRDLAAQRFTRDDLRDLLQSRGAYTAMDSALAQALEQLAQRHGLGAAHLDEALLVGGSSLLPEVDERLRRALPSARVGEWNPFGAVATGACEFARGGQIVDQVYHDYALRLADDTGRTVYYELIVPAGTRYPTQADFAERVYMPDPGRPDEVLFEVTELLRLGRPAAPWEEEASGRRVWRPTATAEHARAVVINEGQTLLRLPASQNPSRRLRVIYRVDADRFLRWTVVDGAALLRDGEVLARLR